MQELRWDWLLQKDVENDSHTTVGSVVASPNELFSLFAKRASFCLNRRVPAYTCNLYHVATFLDLPLALYKGWLEQGIYWWMPITLTLDRCG